MKKKIMGLIAVVAIAIVTGYNAYTSQNNAKLSSLALSNHSIFRLDTHRNPAYLCAITNY